MIYAPQGGFSWVGNREKQRGFRCSFLLLRSDKLSVFPNIVVVFIRQRFGLPPCDKSRKPVYKNILHFIGVRTRLLVAEAEGFEPSNRLLGYLISSQARYDHFDTLPYGFQFNSQHKIWQAKQAQFQKMGKIPVLNATLRYLKT